MDGQPGLQAMGRTHGGHHLRLHVCFHDRGRLRHAEGYITVFICDDRSAALYRACRWAGDAIGRIRLLPGVCEAATEVAEGNVGGGA